MRGPTAILPLSALVGQELVRQALILLAVDPSLSGVLLRGDKGTAKSTAARGLARLLPPMNDGTGLPPFVTLPLGVTEDQLVGTLDLERALKDGEKRFQPGLLARAHGGVLYVDEVNLLEDHIVDLLLDVAASGVNVVARDGVTTTHAAELVLVGTMNPEEGELRPQLLDRFGMCVELRGETDEEMRAEIVTRVLAFESDPQGFHARWAEAEAGLAADILRARALLPEVRVDPSWHRAAARLSLALDVAGHRADILAVKAARVLAALADRRHVEPIDLETAATLVYPHRLRRRPFDEARPANAELREEAQRCAAEAREEKKAPS